ncbi:hypothetical protein B0I35DRAFT_264487 [Stachybotrys elegans]|uniref:TRP C-terminal domain-containing protein n=1 Tax=Stachybotrys elegans TaxID=80388 RepID=A0A8K0SV03_9HYPO|nr:hypothetical protein B0I35DRAFT_264487 [Stachybotrys elegans]
MLGGVYNKEMADSGAYTTITKIRLAPVVAAFLGISLFQAIAVTALQSVILVNWQEFLKPTVMQVPRGLTVPTNLSVFIFGFVFQLLFMYDAVRLRSTAQAILACVVNAGFLPFAVFQRMQIWNSIVSLRGSTDINGDSLVHLDVDVWRVVGPLSLAISAVVGLCTIFMVIATWYLGQYFSWQSYRNVNADAKLRRMRINHQIFVMLAKVDLYFIMCFHIIYSVSVLRGQGSEFIINMVLLTVAIVIIVMSLRWSKTENRTGMLLSILVYISGLAYFLYKVIDIHVSKRRSIYSSTIEALTTFGCMAIGFIFATTVYAIICTTNFWRGLKEHLGKHEEGWERRLHTSGFDINTNIDLGYKNVPSVRDLDS